MTTRPGHPLEIGSGKGIVTRWGNRMVQLAAPGRSNVFKNQAKEVLAKFFVTCALHLGMMSAFCFNDLPKAKYITSELRSNTLSNPTLRIRLHFGIMSAPCSHDLHTATYNVAHGK